MGAQAPAVATVLTPEQEIAEKLAQLDNIKNILLAFFDPKKIEEWPGDKGPMYNLHFKNPKAESPVKQFLNKEGVQVPVATIGEFAEHVVANLKNSGYWIQFQVNRPDGRGGTVPTDITMWAYAKNGGFVVCKGREQFASAITGSVSKSQPKQPKVVDASGNETNLGNINLNLGLFSKGTTAGTTLVVN
jgi:hypothetical protein